MLRIAPRRDEACVRHPGRPPVRSAVIANAEGDAIQRCDGQAGWPRQARDDGRSGSRQSWV